MAEQVAVLVVLDATCAAWAAATVWQRRQHQRGGGRPQAGQRWRTASAGWVAVALAGHAARVALRAGLGDAKRGGDSLADVLSAVLCSLLLVLHAAWQDNRRLWLLATPVASAGALDAGALAEAVQAFRRAAPQQGDASGGWAARHYEAAALGLAALSVAALLASTCCLLAGAAAPKLRQAGAHEPLLGARKRRGGRGEGVLRRAFTYLVPDQLQLRVRLVACFLLLLVGRIVNIALPLAYKHVVDRLADVSAAAAAAAAAPAGGMPSLRALCASLAAAAPSFRAVFFPWIAAYLGLTFLQGSSGKGGIGLLANVRDLLFIPLQQRACRRVSLDVFAHLLRLDHAFHLHRNTGKVMRILDRGTSSIQDLAAVVLFNLLPAVLDVVVACVFMALKLRVWNAVIVTVVVITYVPLTFVITEYRGKVRKQMNARDNEKEGKATDMLLNIETVKLFTNERFELRAFGAAIDAFQASEYLQLACISGLNIAQSVLVFMGMALGLVSCVRGVLDGKLTVGDAVLFLSLMGQLVAPLTFFGSYYRQIQKGVVDMENMFELLQRKPEVDDAPGAARLEVARGAVALDNVTFSYGSGPPVLRNVSFSIDGGRTLALVGATGSGKSTLLRLLLRFYDPCAGRVLVDGVDVAGCTLASLRGAVAVVPQDTVLFNASLMYNVRYGRTDASDEEVVEAARVAHIHEAVVRRFPDGYGTVVGERGLRLSGGEKQRVAFARAILRHPRILILDEATSALDSITESRIQESLAAMRRTCTTIVVAHRLSTVADADHIVVMADGTVAEAGSHAELLQRGGRYAAMWQQQQAAAAAGSFSQQAEAVEAAAAAAVATVDRRHGASPSRGTSGGEEEEADEEEET